MHTFSVQTLKNSSQIQVETSTLNTLDEQEVDYQNVTKSQLEETTTEAELNSTVSVLNSEIEKDDTVCSKSYVF